MWMTTVKINYVALTKMQKKAAKNMMNQENQIAGMTLRQCAKGAGVGQPTVVRMLQKCGFDGWAGFQKEVFVERLKNEAAKIQIRQTYDHLKGRHAAVAKIIQDDMQVIANMAQQLNMEQLDAVVKRIKRAKIIDVYGTDNSANAATELAGRFLHLGLTSRNYSDLFFQKISAGHLGKKDVAIGFSMSGETMAIIQALASAKMSGAVTVAVTGDEKSALAKVADYVFITPTVYYNETSRWISPRVSQIVFVDALCAAILESDKERFNEQLSKSTSEFEDDILDRAKK